MFGGDGPFWIYPDMDGDGDHDLRDHFIYEDEIEAVEAEAEGADAPYTRAYFQDELDDDEDDEDDEDDDFGALYEYQAHSYVAPKSIFPRSGGMRRDIFAPDDFDSDDNDDDLFDYNTDVSEPVIASAALQVSVEVTYPGKEYLEAIKESDFPNRRTYDAAYQLCMIEHGDPYIPPETTKEDEAERYRFILSQSCIAARYLTECDGFIFTQAIKDNFSLPIQVVDEDSKVKNIFTDVFMELADEDVALAVEVWVWCIKEFGPYQKYMTDKGTIYNHILFSIDDYPNEFLDVLIDRLGSDEDFCKGLLIEQPNTPYCVADMVVRALSTRREKVAQIIFSSSMQHPEAKGRWKECVIRDIIKKCSNWSELKTMASFQLNILPIVQKMSDKRIQRLYPEMAQDVQEYIRSMEESLDEYQCTGRFAWRTTCVDGSPYGINPYHYSTEEQYLEALEEKKYGWRKHCNKRFGVSPEDYETKQAYEDAVKIAAERETQIMREFQGQEPVDARIYSFCKVSLHYPDAPYYYYLTGGMKMTIGDKVIVPYGKDNVATEAVVVSVGECLASAFPCKIHHLKTVTEIVSPDKN